MARRHGFFRPHLGRGFPQVSTTTLTEGVGGNPVTPIPYASDLKARYDAAQGVTISGLGVSQWDDISGNGFHLTQGTDALRPQSKTVVGKKSIWAGGASSPYRFDIPAGLSLDKRNTTVFAVYRTANVLTQTIIHMPAGATAHAFYTRAGTGTAEQSFFNATVRNPNLDISMGVAVGVAVNRTAEVKLFLGKESGGGLTASPAGTVSGGWVFNWNGTINPYFGHLYELDIYNRALTDPEIAEVAAYLVTKHGALGFSADTFLLYEGSSTTAGVGTSVPEDFGYAVQLERLCTGLKPKWYNVSNGGDTIQNMAASPSEMTGQLTKNSAYTNRIVLLQGGQNDINGGRTAAQMKADYGTWTTAIRTADPGAKILGETVVTRTDFDSSEQAVRADFNAWLMATADLDMRVDVAADARLSDPNNATYFNADHPTDAGAAVYAELVYAALHGAGYV